MFVLCKPSSGEYDSTLNAEEVTPRKIKRKTIKGNSKNGKPNSFTDQSTYSQNQILDADPTVRNV